MGWKIRMIATLQVAIAAFTALFLWRRFATLRARSLRLRLVPAARPTMNRSVPPEVIPWNISAICALPIARSSL